MTTYEEALTRAQGMIDAAYNNALTYEGASKYGMARANTLAGLAKAQLDLAGALMYATDAPEPEETPAGASLGLLLRMLEDNSFVVALSDVLRRVHSFDSTAAIRASNAAVTVIRGIVHAAPTEQRVTLASEADWIERAEPSPAKPDFKPEPEGNYFPSYRDATYKTADYPPKETVGPKCNVINDNGVMCQYPYHHDDWINPHSHSWEPVQTEPESEPNVLFPTLICARRKDGELCVLPKYHAGKHGWEE